MPVFPPGSGGQAGERHGEQEGQRHAGGGDGQGFQRRLGQVAEEFAPFPAAEGREEMADDLQVAGIEQRARFDLGGLEEGPQDDQCARCGDQAAAGGGSRSTGGGPWQQRRGARRRIVGRGYRQKTRWPGSAIRCLAGVQLQEQGLLTWSAGRSKAMRPPLTPTMRGNC